MEKTTIAGTNNVVQSIWVLEPGLVSHAARRLVLSSDKTRTVDVGKKHPLLSSETSRLEADPHTNVSNTLFPGGPSPPIISLLGQHNIGKSLLLDKITESSFSTSQGRGLNFFWTGKALYMDGPGFYSSPDAILQSFLTKYSDRIEKKDLAVLLREQSRSLTCLHALELDLADVIVYMIKHGEAVAIEHQKTELQAIHKFAKTARKSLFVVHLAPNVQPTSSIFTQLVEYSGFSNVISSADGYTAEGDGAKHILFPSIDHRQSVSLLVNYLSGSILSTNSDTIPFTLKLLRSFKRIWSRYFFEEVFAAEMQHENGRYNLKLIAADKGVLTEKEEIPLDNSHFCFLVPSVDPVVDINHKAKTITIHIPGYYPPDAPEKKLGYPDDFKVTVEPKRNVLIIQGKVTLYHSTRDQSRFVVYGPQKGIYIERPYGNFFKEVIVPPRFPTKMKTIHSRNQVVVQFEDEEPASLI